MNKVRDQIMVCAASQQKFLLTEGEQQFFASKGFPNPKRCQNCGPRGNW